MEKMRASACARSFTLIELLVVVTIIAILASLAFPVFTSMQERARITQDLNNLRQIGIGTQTYLNDHDSVYFLPTDDWSGALHAKYLPVWTIFLSPFDKRPPSETTPPVSYGFNENAKTSTGSALSSDQVVKPSEFILFAPAQPFTKTAGDNTQTVNKDNAGSGGLTNGGTHGKGTHIDACFGDLHVENLTWALFHSDTPAAGSSDTYSARWHPDPK